LIADSAKIGTDRSALIIEDALDMRMIVFDMLRTLGFSEIAEAGSREEAVKLVANRTRGYDLIVVDYRLPDGDGVTTINSIRANLPAGTEPPEILIITWHSEEVYVRTAQELNVRTFLAKPISLNQLKEKVTYLLAMRAQRPGSIRSARQATPIS